MLAKTFSFGLLGLEAYPVIIEVDVGRGLPSMAIVGLPDNAIKESKQRVRSAIRNSDLLFEPRRITVNLSPADIKKEGPAFDLAMAIGILAATEQISPENLNQFAICGELSLDGRIQPIRGALTIAMALAKTSLKGLILPTANIAEAAIAQNVALYPARTLSEAINILSNPQLVKPFERNLATNAPSQIDEVDFNDVKGQTHVKRGLEIAAAGGHNVILVGPPGSGKSMLAKRFLTIMPEMTFEEALETTNIHSASGLIKNGHGLMMRRPFRSPHHTTSDVALVGGGSHPKPGEITLSHNGVLFLDELPEFHRNALEALRQPMEDQHVTIARANHCLKFPANFTLIAAMNPCHCGWLTDRRKTCHCNPIQVQRYLSKISGPLLDRIDIHLDVPSVEATTLFQNRPIESSSDIKMRTTQARKIQRERFGGESSIHANAQMSHSQIRKFCPLDKDSADLLKTAIDELGLSARAHDKVIKIARTIADLDGKTDIETNHIAEAIQYRNLDRTWG